MSKEQLDSILEELDLASVPRLLVLNKWDLVPVAAQAELGDALPDAFHVSAASGQGLKELMQALEMRILTLNKVLLPEASADNINA